MRDMSDEANQKCHRIYNKYCPNFKGFGGGIEKDDARIKLFFDNKYEYLEYDNPLFYDKERFISRNLSGSYSLQPGHEHYNDYFNELSELFEQHATNGILTMKNKTVVYLGNI